MRLTFFMVRLFFILCCVFAAWPTAAWPQSDALALGPNHPNTAAYLNTLAVRHRIQGRYAKAESLFKRSLAIRDKTLGGEHLDVAATLDDLALLYAVQGRYREAEPLVRRSLTISRQALGPDHVNVAVGLNNLAALYRVQNRHQAAEPLFSRSLAISERAMGPDHPVVAAILINLAALYRVQGHYAKAVSRTRRASAILRRGNEPRARAPSFRFHVDLRFDEPVIFISQQFGPAATDNLTVTAFGAVFETGDFPPPPKALGFFGMVDLMAGFEPATTPRPRRLSAVVARAEEAPNPAAPSRPEAVEEPRQLPQETGPIVAAAAPRRPARRPFEREPPVTTLLAPSTPARGDDRFVLHLASFRTPAAANREWRRLKRLYAELLSDTDLLITRVELPERGVYQRVMAAAFADRAAAKDRCVALRARDQYCLVMRR